MFILAKITNSGELQQHFEKYKALDKVHIVATTKEPRTQLCFHYDSYIDLLKPDKGIDVYNMKF